MLQLINEEDHLRLRSIITYWYNSPGVKTGQKAFFLNRKSKNNQLNTKHFLYVNFISHTCIESAAEIIEPNALQLRTQCLVAELFESALY